MSKQQGCEILRLRAYHMVDTEHVATAVFVAQSCRRTVTVRWDYERKEMVFEATVPLPKKLAAVALPPKRKGP